MRNAKRADKLVNRSLWLVVLGVILTISAYSFYVIARKLGVPPIIAIGVSTCFDGVTLLAANYSVRYTADGLSGSFPRAVVRIAALLTAYLQTFHAITKDGYSKSWVIWASLPIAAMVVYEIHIRWAKRKALINGNATFPAPLPSFGFITWCLFPRDTLANLRQVVERRRQAVLAHSLAHAQIISDSAQLISVQKDDSAIPQKPKRAIASSAYPSGHRDAPVLHIRLWAKQQGYEIGERGRIRPSIVSAYNSAMAS